MASAINNSIQEKRKRVFLNPLPPDFLRLNVSIQQQQEAVDRQTAIALHQQYSRGQFNINAVGRLNITICQAKLAKNYGMVRMDPYARIRVGHCVYETQADYNGSKFPRWNKVMHCLLPQGINTITIEIFDERSFSMDELIAWTQITIPKQVLAGETHDDWYPLNGKQGEGVEGMINLVLSYVVFPTYNIQNIQPVVNVGGTSTKPITVYSTSTPAPAPPLPILSESELKQIEEMFPNIDKEVIKTVFEVNRGNKDGTINSLLQMAE